MVLVEVYCFRKHLKQLLTLILLLLSLAGCHIQLDPWILIEDNDEYSVNHNFSWSHIPFLMYLLLQVAILCTFQSTSV